jgi:hypothetical protein
VGNRLLSIKAGAWGGVTRQLTNDRQQRKFIKLENCYVSGDGQEIRQFPGYGTFIDLTEENNSLGYSRLCPDAVRPVLEYTSPTHQYNNSVPYSSATSQTLWSRAKMTHLFGFEQIGNEVFIVGESRYREDPIYDSTGAQMTITAVSNASAGSTYGLTLSNTVLANSFYDSGGVGMNGLQIGDVITVESITTGNASDQAIVQADLVGKQHEVTNIVGAQITLSTCSSSALSGPAPAATGSLWRIRANRNNYYPSGPFTPATDIYDSTLLNRPDDPDALTVWRVNAPIDMLSQSGSGGYDNEYPCYPAWVANRQRDFGDWEGNPLLGAGNSFTVEGTLLDGSPLAPVRGVSRREQRRLPYRPQIEPALDRLLLAAPGYGCMFQIPAVFPLDSVNWQSPTSSTVGIESVWNSVFDKPRSLGIPKARLVESQFTPAQISPGTFATGEYGSMLTPFDAGMEIRFGSPELGLAPGTYRLAIAWEDTGTGDEGLASEPIEVDIPDTTTRTADGDFCYTIRINYVHPGYHMPECLGLRMNVYLSAANQTALAFYGSFEMEQYDPLDAGYLSGHFGFRPCTPGDPNGLVRTFRLPIVGDSTTGSIDDVLDPTRLAPQSNSMPRGAEACKYIRGVLFSGGALGNAGRNGQLWAGQLTKRFNASDFWLDDEVVVQAHSLGSTAFPPTSGTTDAASTGTLGIAGRCFPDAYQGIEFVEDGLLPGESHVARVDRVMNRRVQSLFRFEAGSPGNLLQHMERLRLTRTYVNRQRWAGYSPGGNLEVDNRSKNVHFLMPRGQLQIGDPGEPQRASKAFIKLVDPRRGDDIKAIGQLGGSAIICTQKETFSYSFYRNAAADTPNMLSEEFGCIGNNTMVEFDGGLAWISDRGPVALGQGVQHVGLDIAEDFYGDDRRYIRDTKGMMRHAWGAHDAQRGLVIWGMVTRTGTQQIVYDNQTVGPLDLETLNERDEALSRFPCDEMIVWSYRANAFSTWRPPAGLEVYWMRPLRDNDGITRMCFLAADGVIYALDDEWGDANGVFGASMSVLTVGKGANSTTLQFDDATTFKDGDTGATTKKNLATYLRPGMLVEFLDAYGNVVAETAIASVTTTGSGVTSEIELTAAQSWGDNQTVRIGGRARATITSTYIGSEVVDTMQVQRVQVRYATEGTGHANARVKMFRPEMGVGTGEQAISVDFTTPGQWEAMGFQKAGTTIPSEITRLGRRTSFSRGQISGQELAVQVELTGQAQVRIQDISLEVG